MDRHDPHRFRREFADEFDRLRQAYDLEEIARKLSHTSRAVTERYYRRWS